MWTYDLDDLEPASPGEQVLVLELEVDRHDEAVLVLS
jgi:hypothetical protein